MSDVRSRRAAKPFAQRPTGTEVAKVADAADDRSSGPQPDAASGEMGPVLRWIHEHDDSWLFTILYVSLALVLSIWISLFWLVVVVGIHLGLELIRQSAPDRNGWRTLGWALWEVKLDVSLVLFALALTAYMDLLLGVAGLGNAARLGVKSGARAGGWARAIRGTLLSLDDAVQVARVAATKLPVTTVSSGDADGADADVADADDAASGDAGSDAPPPANRSAASDWGYGDWAAILLGVACVLAIVAAPWLTEHSVTSLVAALLADLQPFP